MELHSLDSGTSVADARAAQGDKGSPAADRVAADRGSDGEFAGRRFDAVISDEGIQLSEVDAAPPPAAPTATTTAADVEAESGPDRPTVQMNEDWTYTQRGASARAPAVSPLGQTLDVMG